MVKPIGNLQAGINSTDKISRRMAAKYGPKSGLPGSHDKTPANPPQPRQKPKYKTRKR